MGKWSRADRAAEQKLRSVSACCVQGTTDAPTCLCHREEKGLRDGDASRAASLDNSCEKMLHTWV